MIGLEFRRNVDDFAPLSQLFNAAERRKQLQKICHDVLDQLESPALRVGDITVARATNYQLSFVRLAHIDIDRARIDHGVEYRLNRLRYESLQGIAL